MRYLKNRHSNSIEIKVICISVLLVSCGGGSSSSVSTAVNNAASASNVVNGYYLSRRTETYEDLEDSQNNTTNSTDWSLDDGANILSWTGFENGVQVAGGSYSFDVSGKVSTSLRTNSDGSNSTVLFTHDTNGMLSRIDYDASSLLATFSYNSEGKLSTRSHEFEDPSSNNITNYFYSESGLLQRHEYSTPNEDGTQDVLQVCDIEYLNEFDHKVSCFIPGGNERRIKTVLDYAYNSIGNRVSRVVTWYGFLGEIETIRTTTFEYEQTDRLVPNITLFTDINYPAGT